ncbi:MAG: hypothetical protein Q9163_006352 [Psora crenata]
MASATTGNPYGDYNDREIEQDFTDPDNGVNGSDHLPQSNSDRAPLTGNIQSSSSLNALPRTYLNSSIPGEDRSAPTNTIEESVWETLSRDLSAVWEKMRHVLWPKYLLSGFLQQGAGFRPAERVDDDNLAGEVGGIAGGWPDADAVLQGGMSEGLRDWDLWGPLIFCLLLSLLLSMTTSSEQRTTVFSGVFALVWVGEAVVTTQIKLLGGNIITLGLTFALMTQLGRDEQTVQHGSRSRSDCSRGFPPPDQTPSESISDNDTGERPVREQLKKASLASISGDPAQPTFAQPEEKNDMHSSAMVASRTARTTESGGKEESRGRPVKKRSFDDLDSTENDQVTLPKENKDITNGHARKRSRDVRAGVPQRAHDKPSPRSPLHEELEGSLANSSRPGNVVTIAPLEHTGKVSDNMKSNVFTYENSKVGAEKKQRSTPLGSQSGMPEAEPPVIQKKAGADQESREGAASPRKKRSRDQLDTEQDREQKIAATEEVRAQRLSNDLDRSEIAVSGKKSAVSLDTSDLGQPESNEQFEPPKETPTRVFGISSAKAAPSPPRAVHSPSQNSVQQTTSTTAFASSGFAALAASSASPFGIIGATPNTNLGNLHEGTINGVKSAVVESTSSNPPERPSTIGFGSCFKASASGFSGAELKPFTVAAPTNSGAFGPSAEFGATFGARSKMINFAAPKGDANIGGRNDAVKPIGSPELHDEDGRSSDSGGDEANETSRNEKDEVDERFQQQDVETGEDGEDSLFSARASLYSFRGAWKESGKGVFKFNVTTTTNEEPNRPATAGRFIMRAHQTFRVLLNAPVFKGMKVGDSKGNEPSGKSFAFAVIEDGKPTPHMVKLGDVNESRALYHAVLKLQNERDREC